MVKNPPAKAGDVRDMGSIPGSERSPGRGHGNPLQYSYMENLMNRGAWPATVCRVAELDTLKQLSMHACTGLPEFSSLRLGLAWFNLCLESKSAP